MTKIECILDLLNKEFLSIKEISERLNYTIPIIRVSVKRLLDRNQVIIYKKRDQKNRKSYNLYAGTKLFYEKKYLNLRNENTSLNITIKDLKQNNTYIKNILEKYTKFLSNLFNFIQNDRYIYPRLKEYSKSFDMNLMEFAQWVISIRENINNI